MADLLTVLGLRLPRLLGIYCQFAKALFTRVFVHEQVAGVLCDVLMCLVQRNGIAGRVSSRPRRFLPGILYA